MHFVWFNLLTFYNSTFSNTELITYPVFTIEYCTKFNHYQGFQVKCLANRSFVLFLVREYSYISYK